jgi:hypothetical protein
MAKVETVGDGWASYLEDVVKANPFLHTADHHAFKSAFYAGAMVFMTVAAEGTPEQIAKLCFELHVTMGEIAGFDPEKVGHG